MTEAKQLYDDWLQALSPLLPRTVYQDVRRVRTLAWALTGLCLSRSVQLGAWAEVTQGYTQDAASRVRRFSRLPAPPCYYAFALVSACTTSRPRGLAC